MPAPTAVTRGLVALMNAVPSAAAVHFDTSARSTRVLRPLVNALLPTAPTTVVIRAGPVQGTRLQIDPRREKFYWTGRYETGVQDAFVRVLHPGATAWDVGAHIGFFTALAAQCVGRSGRVHAFEPLPANRARLLKTIELNGLAGVEVHPNAVAAFAGTRQLFGHPSTSMWSLIEGASAERVEVQCVTLDGLLSEGSCSIPALVKIDAEGAELDILRGGLRLANTTDAAFVVEFNDAETVAEARALAA